MGYGPSKLFDRAERATPPPPPAGYDVIERNGSYWPVAVEGAYRPTMQDAKGTRLSERPQNFPGDERTTYRFSRDGSELCYNHEYPARWFLRNWVNLCGGMQPFDDAWEDQQEHERIMSEPLGVERALRYLSHLLEQMADNQISKHTATVMLHTLSDARSGVPDEMREIYGSALVVVGRVPD
jgi:hypothetical protein